MKMEYFAVSLQRWGSGGGGIELPVTDEFQDDLTLLDDLIRFIHNPDQLPKTYQLMFQLVRLADYTGCDLFLQTAAAKLGTTVQKINNSNPIRKVRSDLRNRYRISEHMSKMRGGLEMCKLCKKTLLELPVLMSDSVTVLPCCSAKVHLNCFKNPTECPMCETSFTHFLNCCICKQRIVCDESAAPTFAMNWVHPKTYQTSCCGADVHQKCHNFYLRMDHCNICSVPLKNGELQYFLCEGLDILHVRIWR